MKNYMFSRFVVGYNWNVVKLQGALNDQWMSFKREKSSLNSMYEQKFFVLKYILQTFLKDQ